MKKKTAAIAALATCIALSATATFGGCSLVSSNNRKDMEQVIAEVDVSNSDKFPAGLAAYKGAITTTSIVKRELVSYFLNVGYSYIQSGYTYEKTFNQLVDTLVENAVLTQYCTLELLAQSSESSALETFLGFETDVERYEYLLGSENVGTDSVVLSDDVYLARYSLYSSLNSAIDNYEKIIIDEEDEYKGSDTRTTPVNLNAEQDDYYPHAKDGGLDYCVYTGYKGYLLSDSGIYKEDALEGTTRLTRLRAYNGFINNLRNNYLIDAEKEDLTDIMSLDYIQSEYLTRLKSRAVTKYFDGYEEGLRDALKSGETEATSHLQYVYKELVKQQERDYSAADGFESALGGMSSESFILYSPATDDSDKFDGTNSGRYGFVYNILLPFDAIQSAELAVLNGIRAANDDDDLYFYERNQLLKDIKTVDRRSAWFNGATKYALDATESGLDIYSNGSNSKWLFFEDNLTDSGDGGRYEKLQAYTGSYPYNGKVFENENGSYTLLGKKLDIDGMLKEFSAYINYVLGGEKVSFDGGYTPEKGNAVYYNTDKFHKADDEDEIDYSKFVYASGKVNIAFNKADLMKDGTEQYRAMSAVNELQFAYTTDTGVLSNYIGYSVSAYDTSYIKEFEYAAKLAINKGEGGFAVCAGDYGWHLIYVTYAFDVNGGEVYTPDWTRVSEEGTFENLFFEMITNNNLAKVSTTLKSKIISDFNKDASVTKYRSRYQDLLDLGD